jgi:hypothetical protein
MALRNAFADLATEDSTQTILYLLAQIIDKMARIDTADRMAVSVEAGTLPTVTTVSDVTRLNSMGGASRVTDFIPHNTSMLGAAHIYNQIIVS